MKKVFTFLTALVGLILTSNSISAYDFEVDGLYYKINYDKKSVTVTYKVDEVTYKSIRTQKEVVKIPKKVSYKGVGYKVTAISESAFQGCANLKKVTIPKTVTYIGECAFSESGIESVEVPSSVVGSMAFQSCPHLKSVRLSDNVCAIEDLVFAECNNLESVSVGKSVAFVGKNVLVKCPNLTTLTVNPKNNNFDSRNNCNAIVNKYSNELVSACKATTIPESVEIIGEGVFNGLNDLSTLTIPENVKVIAANAFCHLSNLTVLTCLAVDLPACNNDSFYGIDKSHCTLRVPAQSVEKYKAHNVWSEFRIVGF